MPGRTKIPRNRVTHVHAKPGAAEAPGHALLVIDHERLQHAAWAEFHTVRKRLDQAARELHRHEEIDVPAYETWLHRTFPLQVTSLRELNEEVMAKTRQVRVVQARAAQTGRSLKRLWQEEKQRAANPGAFREKSRDEREPGDEENDSAGRRQDARPEDFEARARPTRAAAVREIFRRLVQRLHPDRGGAWTPARQHLWHEVLQAWTAGDGDWLARLEVEWETEHEVVGSNSPLSRLRGAIEELHAARRDIEHKLSEYRTALAWRFTRSGPRRAALERRVEAEFAREFRALRQQLKYLDATIAAWDEDWTRAKTRPQPRARRYGFRRPQRKNFGT